MDLGAGPLPSGRFVLAQTVVTTRGDQRASSGPARPEENTRTVAFVPASLKDETLFSLLARQRQHLYSRLHSPFVEAAFGKGTRRLCHLMPGRLAFLSTAFGLDMPPVAVMRRWTALAYLAPFMAVQDVACAEAGLWSGDVAGLRVVSRYMGRGRAHKTLNWCAKCMSEDLAAEGTTAWRRTHQLPGVFACPRHGIPLLGSSVPALGWQGLIACPEDGDAPALNLPFELGKAVRLAKASEWLLLNPQPPQPSRTVQAVFRDLLRERNLLGPNGTGVAGLPIAIAAASGGECVGIGGRGRGSVQRLWGRTERLGVSTRVVLLALDYLGIDVAEFFARCTDLMAKSPIQSAGRPKPKVRKSTIVKHRSNVIASLADRQLCRSEIRLAVPTACCVLLEHDRDWLETVLPPSRKPRRNENWRGKDCHLATEAKKACAALLSRPGLPSRITFSAVATHMGLRTTLYRRDGRLPRTLAIIDAAVETPPQVMRRRAQWAIGPGCDPSITTWSAFARHAAFKEPKAGPEVTAWARELFAKATGQEWAATGFLVSTG